jgi:hypothetical protein
MDPLGSKYNQEVSDAKDEAAFHGAGGDAGGHPEAPKVLKDHPNYSEDDYQALSDKGYSPPEILGIWNKDTEGNGGNPTGGNPRNDLKLPSREHPDGQPGPAAKAKASAKATPKVLVKPSAKASGKPSVDPKHLDLMEDSLSNDDGSSDEELVDHFTGQGVPPEHAQAAVKHRDKFLTGMPKKGALQGFMDADGAKAGGDVPRETGAAPVKHESKFHTDPGKADADIAARKADLEAKGFKHEKTDKHAFGVNDHYAHEDGSRAVVGKMNPDVNPEGRTGVNSYINTTNKGKKKPAGGGASLADEAKDLGAPSPKDLGAVGDGPSGRPDTGAPPQQAVPPHADAQQAGWGNLPDDENPEHALSGLGSKALGRMATMKPEHAKAHAHAELANRGLDSDGEWVGFDKANAHHSFSGLGAPGFKADPEIGDHMQTVHRKVLTAAAGGHLDLQKRAKAALASRGHDSHGNWLGFDKAKEHHGLGGQKDLFKATPMLLVKG